MDEEEKKKEIRRFRGIAKQIGLLKRELEEIDRRISYLFILSISISILTSCLTVLLVEI